MHVLKADSVYSEKAVSYLQQLGLYKTITLHHMRNFDTYGTIKVKLDSYSKLTINSFIKSAE